MKLSAGWVWAVLLLFLPVDAAFAAEGFRGELAPYAWLTGVDGKLDVAGRSVDIDWSFSDLVDDVDAAAMGMAVLRYDNFVAYLDYDYMSLGTSGNVERDVGPNQVPVGTKVHVDLDLTIATGAVGYQFDLDKHFIDVLIGYRGTDVEAKTGIGSFKNKGKVDLKDTLLIVSPSLRLSDRFRFKPMFSYGIAGDSDTTWELQPTLLFEWTPSITLGLGYRKLHYDNESGQKNTLSYRKTDIDLDGLMLGFSWGFGEGRRQ